MTKRIASVVALALAAAPLMAQNLTSAHKPARPDAPEAPAKALPHRPETFGTLQTTYVQIPPNAFQPHRSDQTYESDNYGLGPRWTTSIAHDLLAPLHLPAGARIVSLEMDYEDSNANSLVYGTLVVCDYLGQNCVLHPVAGEGPADCLIPGFICSGLAAAPGLGSQSTDLSGDNITVNNFLNSYTVLAEPGATDGSEKIAGMIVGYVLQVSPAPATPSFNDVPTNDFGFQYIEALALSGITGGCQASLLPRLIPDAAADGDFPRQGAGPAVALSDLLAD
jgi:hypothetical protein